MVTTLLWPALLLAGCLLLQRRWRRRYGGRLQLAGGWLLIAAAGCGWTLTSGGERGLALALLLLSPAAWLVIAAHGQWRPPEHQSPYRQPALIPSVAVAGGRWRLWGRGLARTLIGGPLAALASFGVAMLVLAHGPASEVTRLVAVALGAPLLWGLLLALVMMSRRLWPPALLLGALLAASWLLL